MTENADDDKWIQPCWDLKAGWCAARANGGVRCRRGQCWVAEPNQEPLPFPDREVHLVRDGDYLDDETGQP